MIILTIVAALTIDDKLDSFLALLRAFGCIPIAFILPGLFHYRICAHTKS